MNRKGTIIPWDLSKIETTAEFLEEQGYGDYMPSNGVKTALIKALKKLVKEKEDRKIYRKWNDVPGEVSFTIFAQIESQNSLKLEGELSLKLNKRNGKIELLSGSVEAFKTIEKQYIAEGPTIDTNQFRTIIQRILAQDLKAVSLRRAGGAYFVGQRFEEKLAKLRNLFSLFEGSTLYEVVAYDDQETLKTIEINTAEHLIGQIDSLISEITKETDEGILTQKRLDNRKERAVEILSEINLHAENLQKKYKEVVSKAERLSSALGHVSLTAENSIRNQETFLESLANL